MKTTPFVSVILATYNRRNILEECLDSLFSQTYPRDRYEVIVVDDSSPDGTLGFLEEYSKNHPNLKFFTQSNQGPYIAKNLGMKSARGEIICFTGDDCIADRDWVGKLVEGYSEGVGGVGGRIASYPPKTLVERYSYATDPFNQERLSRVYLMTGNASYTRKALEEAGGFDAFFRYSGDCDLGLRVNMAGYRLVYAPEGVVYHKHGETVMSLVEQNARYGRGYSRMHKKYANNFFPMKRLGFIFPRFAAGCVMLAPMLLKSVFVKDRTFYLAKRMLDVGLMVPYMWGMAAETLAGDRYPGERISRRLDFVSAANIMGGWGE